MVETLITTVFVVTILSIIYINFFPLIGEYERREAYDDVDSKYGAFWVKRMIQDSKYNPDAGRVVPFSVFLRREIDCSSLYDNNTPEKAMCDNLWQKLGVKRVFLTHYNITKFKACVANYNSDACKSVGAAGSDQTFKDFTIDDAFKSYIAYLPDYSAFQSYNNAKYRIIVEFEHTNIKDGAGKSIPNYKTFATMEVSK